MKGKIKFVDRPRTEFFNVLRKRVNAYFEENKIDKTGDYRMVLKTVVMLSLYLVPFILICTSILPVWGTFLCWVMMGIGVAGVGMSVMHDANHGAYSKNAFVNTMISRTIYLLGGSKFTWRVQHNILHHTYTNIYGMDEDIHDKPILRLSPHGKLYFIHKFQHIYGWFIYGFATFGWSLNKDFMQLIRYNKNGLTKGSGGRPAIEMIKLIISKILYFAVFLILPALITGYSFGYLFLGFMMMHFVAGLILTTIFQLAHVVEDMEHPVPTADGEIENNWAIHQLQTTANFAKKNRVLSWFVGGLNYQVEHHLFHGICHIHYKNIAPIVKKTAHEYGVPYHEKFTFWQALGSHMRMLKKIGHNVSAV
ncbi:MAG: acyl-CoA desaturase [Fimbriimonadaceae bacterium]|nr:acyl-CoA desaturase [Chitinophagales bacterium]